MRKLFLAVALPAATLTLASGAEAQSPQPQPPPPISLGIAAIGVIVRPELPPFNPATTLPASTPLPTSSP